MAHTDSMKYRDRPWGCYPRTKEPKCRFSVVRTENGDWIRVYPSKPPRVREGMTSKKARRMQSMSPGSFKEWVRDNLRNYKAPLSPKLRAILGRGA